MKSFNSRSIACSVALAAFALSALSLSACTSKIKTNTKKVSELQGAQDTPRGYATGHADDDPARKTMAENLREEKAVTDGVVAAWRKAVKGDEEGAMAMLEELDRQYPGISTVQSMMGQVKEHFGKDKEAAEHYHKAFTINDFSSVQTYKLAESLRRSGDAKGSLVYYEKLLANLEEATNKYGKDSYRQLLDAVRLGYVRALIECGKKPEKQKELLESILKDDPDNKEAQSLLKGLERSR